MKQCRTEEEEEKTLRRNREEYQNNVFPYPESRVVTATTKKIEEKKIYNL